MLPGTMVIETGLSNFPKMIVTVMKMYDIRQKSSKEVKILL